MAQPKDEKVATTESKPSLESLVHKFERTIHTAYVENTPMPEIRKEVSSIITGIGSTMTSEQKKELGTMLRERADRMRRFYESIYTEVVSASSQQGW
jgi:hypothetical protein